MASRVRALLLGAACALAAFPAAARADVGDPTRPSATSSWLAKVVYPTQARSGASDSAGVVQALGVKTKWGGQTQLLVEESERTQGVLWLRVRLAGRPNGRSGWIRADSAQLSETPYRIEIRRSTMTLRLLKAGRTARTMKVVVGAPGTPTPAGTFSLLDKLEVRDTGNFLGSWVLPLTAYSDALQTFDGGPGQIAIHGRGGASLQQPVGTAASHGCVRVENKNIARIA
ncbi:MAG: L,D-transpeptidase, partial [Solirubrobacteraceae bacterium]|nr:L,D-transpeptidase [Solirubrobacteraceae bacterium]